MGTTLKFLSENTVRKCTFGKAEVKEARRLGIEVIYWDGVKYISD